MTGNTDYDTSELQRVFESRFTWAAAFERNTHRFARRPALSDPPSGRSWTYAQLGADTGRLVAGLRERGVDVGDIICHQLKNTPEFAMLYIAAQGLRAVSSPMNFRLAPAETAHILDQTWPAVFVYDGLDVANVATALERAAHRPRILAAVGGGSCCRAPSASRICSPRRRRASPHPRAPARGTRRRASTRREPPACPRLSR